MNINNYILKEIKALTLKKTVKNAQKIFKNYPFTHFPVIKNNKLLGSFAEEDMQIIENKEEKLNGFTHLLHHFFAYENANILELLKIFADNNTTIVPVLDTQKNYIGYYDLCDVLEVFSTSPFMMEESDVLIVEKLITDYSMSQISQIVESNGGKLLGAYVSKKTADFVQVTLKIATNEINEIMQTFRRYDYKITSKHQDDLYLEDLKNRSEYLQKYLEM